MPRVRRPEDRDVLVRVARGFVYVGMFFLPLWKFYFTKNLSVSDGFFALGAVVLALSIQRIRSPKVSGWVLGSILMLLGGITASYFAASPSGSLHVVFNAVYVFFVWQWVMRGTLGREKFMVRSITAFGLGAGLSSLVAIMQAKFHVLGYKAGNVSAQARVVGLSLQPNLIGITNALAIVLFVGLILRYGFGKMAWRGICVAALVLALLLTASVSGEVCALLGTLFLLIRSGVRIRRILACGVVVFGLYAAAGAIEGHAWQSLNPFSRFHETTTAGSGYNTVSLRQETWTLAWKGIQESPIWGHGLDQVSGAVYYDPYLKIAYPAHNIILMFWYQGGLLFLVGGLMAMFFALRRLVGRRRGPLQDVVLAGCVTVLIGGMAGPALVDRWLWMPFVLALCFRLGAQAEEPDPGSVPEEEPVALAGPSVRPVLGAPA
jgi:hypothetical protein